jgi:hypothetical protein
MLKTREGLANADFGIEFRIQSLFQELPHVFVQGIAEATHTPAMIIFYILAQVLG